MLDRTAQITLRDIIELVELDKPSREADCLIWAALNRHQITYKEDTLYIASLKVGKIRSGFSDETFSPWGNVEKRIPYYTTDIAGALDIIHPEWTYELVRMPNGWFRVMIRGQINGGGFLFASKAGLKSRCAAVLSAALQAYVI